MFVGTDGIGAGAVLTQQKKTEEQDEPSSKKDSVDDNEQSLNGESDEEIMNAMAELRDEDCHPQHKVVFIKTHKTASTTSASLFERYGYSHNLTFALPWVTHIFHESKLFNRDMVMTFQGMTTFDMLTNHARFNRKEMEAVVPHAKYVTIIRDPASQLESAFAYFEMAESLGIKKYPDPLGVFLENPKKYSQRSFHMSGQSWNGQLYDLGLGHEYCNDSAKVKQHIEKIDTEIDLVMLTEYFDESLILLRKLMCWTYKDILFLPKGVRNEKHRYRMSPERADKIRKWNSADLELYQHFNATFWRKVQEYGPDFEEDLHVFRQLQQNMVHVCLDTNKEGRSDYRETKFAMKKKVPEICKDLRRTDMEFVRIIRWNEVKRRFGIKKLLGMIAGSIVLLILILTAMIVLVSKVMQKLCHIYRQYKESDSGWFVSKTKCKYAKISQES